MKQSLQTYLHHKIISLAVTRQLPNLYPVFGFLVHFITGLNIERSVPCINIGNWCICAELLRRMRIG